MPSQIDAVYSAIQNLISKKQRADVFTYFHDHKESSKRFGWEKWFQVELAQRLLKEFGEVFFEVPHTYTKNTKLPSGKAFNDKGFVDLEFRLKHSRRHLRAAVEIKLNRSLKGMGPLFDDFRKFAAFSGAAKNWNYRSVIGVLAYDAPGPNSRNTKFSKLVNELETQGRCKVLKTHPHFHFIVVGWEEKATKNMTRIQFGNWLKDLETAYKQALVELKPTQLQRKALALD